MSPHLTKAFITYTETDLYVGFIAYADMENLRSSIRNRDEGFRDDNVFIGIDTYGDGRYMVGLGANPEGNPNPFTIFYIGGTNGYSQIDTQNRYSIENSQLYLKFQYLFDL